MTAITDTNLRSLEATTHTTTGDIIIVLMTRSNIRHGEWERNSVRITRHELAALAEHFLPNEGPTDGDA